MSTNLEVISAALKDINVVSESSTPSPEQGDYCLEQLNDMLAEWAELDMDLGYFKQTSTADACPIPDWTERAVKAKLAEAVAPHYGASISPDMRKKIDDAYGVLQTRFMVANLKPANMDHMSRGQGHCGSGFDINNG